ncbi:cupin domain-containing protein [Tahibacter amnicola]|uniref:Cupin domain-containing protein n=1 Tax=Tahibacter amnicola TaxID=2976241 RepID=A0ABY6BHF6_9GAMM|nr:cupin domain-containing protein [Tahibacter amnicola]UXI69285.1 cupin domain-containing protein [Tahibacter amnicola]
MYLIRHLAIAAALVLASASVPAQDIIKASPEHNKLLTETAHLRLIEGWLEPGAHQALHEHTPYIVYILEGGSLEVRYKDGKVKKLEGVAGQSFGEDADPPHETWNVGKTKVRWLLIETKTGPKK